MFPSFFRPLLGVDAGAFAVKLVELCRHRRRPCLVRAVANPVLVDTEDAAATFDLEQTAAALAPLVESAGRAAVALPYAAVALHNVNLLRTVGTAELQRRAAEVAQRELSLAADDANLDFALTPSGDGKHNRALLAACAKETLEDYQALLDVHGLTLAAADVDLLAVEHGFFRDPAMGDASVALFDLGHNAIRLSVVRGGVVLHRAAHSTGGALLLAEAQRHYGWDARESRRRLWQNELPADFVDAVQRPFTVALAQAAADSVNDFAADNATDAPREVVLSGGCTALGVCDAIAEQCGLPTRIADPFCAMADSGGTFPADNTRATFAVAAGLALRSFADGAH